MGRRELMFDAASDPSQVFTALASRYTVRAEPATSHRWTCLDTADWRLHRVGLTLREARRGRRTELILSAGESDRVTVPSRSRPGPRRIERLPESPLRERIAAAVGRRALLPLAEVDVRSIPLQVLDDADTTRVRVRVDQQRLAGVRLPAMPLRVLIQPLRGYEADAHRCADLLASAMDAVGGDAGAATFAMIAAGHAPGAPSVPYLRLDPGASAVESLVQVYRHWIDVIDAARPGVLGDVDPDYLRELRSGIRATRAMLKLTEGVLPCPDVASFSAEFASLGRLTTRTRELDMLLRAVDACRLLDGADRDDIELLRRHLLAKRRSARRALRAGLQSAPAAMLSERWRTVLDRIATPDMAWPSTSHVASAQAKRAHRRILTAAAGMTAQSGAVDLHRLRTRCTQLRCLLDSYASIYAPEQRDAVGRRLNKVINLLGEIQDSDTQSALLTQAAAVLTRRGVSVEPILAIGALRDRARRREAAARADLDRRLQRLTSSAIRADVRALTAGDTSSWQPAGETAPYPFAPT